MKHNLPSSRCEPLENVGVDYAVMATSAAAGLIALIYLILI